MNKKVSIIIFLLFFKANNSMADFIENKIEDKYDLQKKAMQHIFLINDAIKSTDYKKAIQGLSYLKKIDFDTISSPLSLAYELISGLRDGREDFLTLGFKYILFEEIRSLAQKIFKTSIEKKRFVSAKTKKNTLEKLYTIKKNLDPSREPCLPIINNINYTIAVIEKLPENNSTIGENLQLISSFISTILYKDSEALLTIIKHFYKLHRDIYLSDMLGQITYIEALYKNLIFYKNPIFFKELLKVYKNTKISEVKYKVLKVLGKIARMHYSSDVPESVFKDIAFTSFNILIKTLNNSNISFFRRNASWWLPCGAAEELILLVNHLKDKNAQKTVERYLIELKRRIQVPKNNINKIKRKLSNVLSNYSATKYLLCILNNKKEIYNLKLISDALINSKYAKENTNTKIRDLIQKSIHNLQNILLDLRLQKK